MGILISAGIGILIASSIVSLDTGDPGGGRCAVQVKKVTGNSTLPKRADVNAVVDRYISQQAKKLGAEEYLEARKVLRGDMNRDGKSDIVVLYTLEGFGGGNNHSQYLAIFVGKGNDFRIADKRVVGGKLSRSVSLISVSKGRIDLDTMEYGKNDPACCPTKEAKTIYTLSNGKLKEVK